MCPHIFINKHARMPFESVCATDEHAHTNLVLALYFYCAHTCTHIHTHKTNMSHTHAHTHTHIINMYEAQCFSLSPTPSKHTLTHTCARAKHRSTRCLRKRKKSLQGSGRGLSVLSPVWIAALSMPAARWERETEKERERVRERTHI